jgi:translocation and assembly module TamB
MHRALRITARTLGGMLLLVVLLGAALLITGNTVTGQRWMERATATVTDGRVRLSGLSGSFPAALDLEQLQLSDAQGPWLTAQRVSLRWSPLALLVHHVVIDELRIGRLDIERRPVSEPEQKRSSSTSLPRTDLRQLSIGSLELGPQLAGSRATLAVQGTVHLISLENAAARIAVRRTDGAGGDYELTVRFDPSHLAGSLGITEPAGGALENLLQDPGLGAVSVVASLNGPRSGARLNLDARAGELRADAQGTVDLTHEAADLAFRLNAPAMTPRPGLSWQRLALEGEWHGAVTAPRADGRLEIAGLQIPGGVGLGALHANLSADHSVFAVHATAEALLLPGPQPRLLADSPLRVAAALRLNDAERPLQLSADHRLFALQARAVTAGTPRATFDLRLPDLAPLAAMAGQKIRGRTELKGTLEQRSATTRLDLEANTDLASGSNVLAGLLGGASRLQLRAALTDQKLDIERLALNGRTLSVSVSGSAERGTSSAAPAVQSVRARYEVGITDLSALSAALGGTLKVAGRLDGPLDSLAAQLQLTSSLAVRGSPRGTVEASLTARGLPSRASATVRAQGDLAGAPLQLDASLERASGKTFHVAVHRAEWRSAHLAGDLTTTADMTPRHGSLNLRIDRLADLQPLLGMPIAGSIAGSLALRPLDHRTYVQLQLDADNIVAASLAASGRLTASGPTEALSLQLNVQSPNLKGEPASLDTTARLRLAAHELGLQRLEARYHGQSLQLLAPARLEFADGLAISRVKLGVQRAVIELDGRLSPALDVRASLHGLDASLVDAFVPDALAAGSLDAEAQLKGSSAAPSGVVTVNALGLRFASSAARDLHALDIHASAHLMENAARLEAHVSAGQAAQLALSGTAPLGAAGALNLRLTGRIDAALVNPVLEARGERASGSLVVDATVTGAASSPEIGGAVDIHNGEFRDYVRGLHLAAVTGHLVGSQGTLRIASLKARAGPGELSVSGTIGVLEPKLPIELRLTAKNAQPITSDILAANLDADLGVKGTLRERLDLAGTIDLHRTVIGIPNAMPPDVAVLDVRRAGQAPPPPPERKLVIGLDLKLHAPREILLQGRGLDAELGGDMHIGGTTASPQMTGGFEMIRGTFALASTKLTFTKGEVTFNGSGLKGKIDPTLDFTAQATTADGTTSTLHITGVADHPQFELSSTPSLPQDEILARLLFGEPAAQLTALQLAQIGAALVSLSGVGGSGPNPLVRVQKALGLDRLSVGGGTSTSGTQSSGASVEAGRYVSDRVYVGAKESTTGFTQMEVDVDLSKHLKLQTRLGNGTATTQGTTPENDPGSTVGLSYQFEY